MGKSLRKVRVTELRVDKGSSLGFADTQLYVLCGWVNRGTGVSSSSSVHKVDNRPDTVMIGATDNNHPGIFLLGSNNRPANIACLVTFS